MSQNNSEVDVATRKEQASMGQQAYNMVPMYTLKLVKERGVRYPVDKVMDNRSAEVILQAYLENKDCEHMVALMLDGQNNVLGLHLVSIGGIAGCGVTVRDIFKAAIVGRASALVLSHSHPSGSLEPSKEDIDLTVRAIEAGKLLGIPCVDHIIVSSGMNRGSYSFLQHNLLF